MSFDDGWCWTLCSLYHTHHLPGTVEPQSLLSVRTLYGLLEINSPSSVFVVPLLSSKQGADDLCLSLTVGIVEKQSPSDILHDNVHYILLIMSKERVL